MDAAKNLLPSTDHEEAATATRHALDLLAKRYWKPVNAFFARRVESRSEANDLTQEVFIRILRRNTGPQIENDEAFIFQTASNLLKDHRRKGAVRARYLSATAASQPAADIITPEYILRMKHHIRTAMQSIAHFPEPTRRAFVLYYVDELKLREIAEILGISISQVDRRISKASAHVVATMLVR